MAYSNKTGFPSVTQIISPFIDKEWFTDESRERGSAVHAACASYAMGLFVVGLPDEWNGYFESFQKWFNLIEPNPIVVETRYVDKKLGYCGQMDLVFESNERILLDIKTAQQQQKWWILQSSAYKHLFEVNRTERIDSCGCLRLRQDGRMPTFDQHPKDTRPAFNTFLSLLNAHKFFND